MIWFDLWWRFVLSMFGPKRPGLEFVYREGNVHYVRPTAHRSN